MHKQDTSRLAPAAGPNNRTSSGTIAPPAQECGGTPHPALEGVSADTSSLGQRDLPPGAPPSNTAPSTCIGDGDGIKPLHLGVDSLYLTFQGYLSLDASIRLRALKEAARSRSETEQEEAVFRVGAHQFEVKSSGRGRFPYVLLDNAYRVELCGIGARKLPLAMVQVRSDWLLSRGVVAVVEELSEVVGKLGTVEGEPCVSRADLCVDFTCDYRLDNLTVDAWVSRARRVSLHTIDRGFTGWSIGLGGDMSARLYDKTKQIVEVNKEYMRDVWRKRGWNGEQTVWRLEFQFKRASLAGHGVDTVDSLLASLGPLWRYATESWLRLTIPNDDDRTQSRWPLHPAWKALSEVIWEGSGEGLSTPARSHSAPSDRYMYENGVAAISSFMAINGILGSKEAFDRYYRAVREYHSARCRITGEDLETYLSHKAAMKAKMYNLPYPGIEERVEARLKAAVAVEYKKAAQGE